MLSSTPIEAVGTSTTLAPVYLTEAYTISRAHLKRGQQDLCAWPGIHRWIVQASWAPTCSPRPQPNMASPRSPRYRYKATANHAIDGAVALLPRPWLRTKLSRWCQKAKVACVLFIHVDRTPKLSKALNHNPRSREGTSWMRN